MTIKLKSIRDSIEPSDGYRMLVVRYPPTNIDNTNKKYWDEICSDLVPSQSLLSNYRNKIYSWERFKDQYYYQMKTYTKSRERIKSLYVDYVSYLNSNSNKNTVTFICYCQDESKCHRNLLKEIVLDAISFLSLPARQLSKVDPFFLFPYISQVLFNRKDLLLTIIDTF